MSTPNQPGGDGLGSMPPQPGADSGPPVRPRSVDLACLLWLLSAVAGIVLTAVTLLGDETALREITRQALDDSGQPTTDADVTQAANTFKTMVIASLAIGFALVLLFVVKMRNGRNWARVVIVACAAMSVMVFLGNAGAIGLGADFVINAVFVALAVATIVYLFRAESNAYFIAVKQRKYGKPPRP